MIREQKYIWLLVPGGVAVGLPFFNYLVDRRRSLSLLLVKIHASLKTPIEADLRCTLLKRGWFRRGGLFRRRMLVEVCRHPPAPERRSKTRMLISQGVAGRCYRIKQQCSVPIVAEDLKTLLVRDFGFTEREAKRFKQDRKSYLCVPILSPKAGVLAVLSLDSSKLDTFTAERIAKVEEQLSAFYEILAL